MAPLVVSITAAIISAFSAWISTRQLFRVQRTRLGELVDEISRADAEYDRILLENDFRIDEGTVSNHELRTEILARQALELVRAARPRPSSREVIVLANTFSRVNDQETAQTLYGQAFAAARQEGPSYLSTQTFSSLTGSPVPLRGSLPAGSACRVTHSGPTLM
jgi:hypothetical protein